MKKLFSFMLLIISALVINACQKAIEVNEDKSALARVSTDKVSQAVDLSVKGDYEVRNGLLYFKNAETFTNVDVVLRKITPDKRRGFTKELGFRSLLDIQLDVYKILSEADSQEKYTDILTSNKDIFKLTGDANRITSVFEEVSAILLNREGMVSIGGRIHCFAKGKTIVASSIEDVRESFKAGKKLKEGTVYYEDKNAGGRLGFGPCSSMFQVAENSDGNRKVEVRVDIRRRIIDIGSNHCDIEYYTYAKGDPFKKSWGSWGYYSTGNTLNSRFSASVKVYHPATVSPAYAIYSANIVDSRSNESTYIDYAYTLAVYYGFVLSSTLNGDGFYFDSSLSENSSNIGTYTSGGVPNGVQMTCP